MAEKSLGFRGSADLQKFILVLGDNIASGAEFGLECLNEIYRSELRTLRGKFSPAELSAMIDVCNGLLLTPSFIGESLGADLEDGAALEGLAEKWGYDSKDLLIRWGSLSKSQRAVMEIWSKGFWRQEALSIEEYVKQLA